VFRKAVIVHHPLLSGDDGQKLSKSAGATSIRFLRQQERTRVEIYRMIGMLLGVEDAVNDSLSLGAAAIAAFKIG
jgi:glutamyl-tRNA synthetase